MTNKKNYTKDEKFMLCIYEESKKCGNMEAEFNRYEIGKLAGINPKGTDATCKLLIQANFIKKGSESDIYLTPHGEKLVYQLRIE